MKFSQLTLKDGSTITGTFELLNANAPGYRVMMFAGTASGYTPSADLAEVMATKRALRGRPDGKRVCLPIDSVIWAEIGEEPPAPAKGARKPDWAPFNRRMREMGIGEEEILRAAGGVASMSQLVAKYPTQADIHQLLELVERQHEASPRGAAESPGEPQPPSPAPAIDRTVRNAVADRLGALVIEQPAVYERIVTAAKNAGYPLRNPGTIALTELTDEQTAGLREIIAARAPQADTTAAMYAKEAAK